MLVCQLEILNTYLETVWQCDTSLWTSYVSDYHALLLVDMHCYCMRIDSVKY